MQSWYATKAEETGSQMADMPGKGGCRGGTTNGCLIVS